LSGVLLLYAVVRLSYPFPCLPLWRINFSKPIGQYMQPLDKRSYNYLDLGYMTFYWQQQLTLVSLNLPNVSFLQTTGV